MSHMSSAGATAGQIQSADNTPEQVSVPSCTQSTDTTAKQTSVFVSMETTDTTAGQTSVSDCIETTDTTTGQTSVSTPMETNDTKAGQTSVPGSSETTDPTAGQKSALGSTESTETVAEQPSVPDSTETTDPEKGKTSVHGSAETTDTMAGQNSVPGSTETPEFIQERKIKPVKTIVAKPKVISPTDTGDPAETTNTMPNRNKKDDSIDGVEDTEKTPNQIVGFGNTNSAKTLDTIPKQIDICDTTNSAGTIDKKQEQTTIFENTTPPEVTSTASSQETTFGLTKSAGTTNTMQNQTTILSPTKSDGTINTLQNQTTVFRYTKSAGTINTVQKQNTIFDKPAETMDSFSSMTTDIKFGLGGNLSNINEIFSKSGVNENTEIKYNTPDGGEDVVDGFPGDIIKGSGKLIKSCISSRDDKSSKPKDIGSLGLTEKLRSYPKRGHGQRIFLLIGNFTNDLKGYNKDMKDLRKFFEEELGYEFIEYVNCSRAELFKAINEVKQRIQDLNKDRKEPNHLIVSILTHGKEKGIYTCADKTGIVKEKMADNNEIPQENMEELCDICAEKMKKAKENVKVNTQQYLVTSMEEIISEFKPDNLPELKGCPKIFFIQACHGEEIVKAAGKSRTSEEKEEEVEDSYPFKPNVPVDADVLVLSAATKYNKSFVSDQKGSWLIQLMLEVFRNMHKKTDLEVMLKAVSLAVSEERGKAYRADGDLTVAMQMPTRQSTLRMNCFL